MEQPRDVFDYYRYESAAGEFYAGYPAFCELTPAEYEALPDYVQRLFVGVCRVVEAPAKGEGNEE